MRLSKKMRLWVPVQYSNEGMRRVTKSRTIASLRQNQVFFGPLWQGLRKNGVSKDSARALEAWMRTSKVYLHAAWPISAQTTTLKSGCRYLVLDEVSLTANTSNGHDEWYVGIHGMEENVVLD